MQCPYISWQAPTGFPYYIFGRSISVKVCTLGVEINNSSFPPGYLSGNFISRINSEFLLVTFIFEIIMFEFLNSAMVNADKFSLFFFGIMVFLPFIKALLPIKFLPWIDICTLCLSTG